MARPSIEVRRVRWTDPAAATLRREMFEDVARLYPGSRDRVAATGGYEAYDARGATGVVAALLALADGEAAGFVAVARLAFDGAGPQGADGAAAAAEHGPVVAELRRMYVRPARRGTGVAQALLDAAREAGRAAGLPRMVLETGTAQVTAQRLYAGAGFRRITGYPPHTGDPSSVCFAVDL